MNTYYFVDRDGAQRHYATLAECKRSAKSYATRERMSIGVYESHNAASQHMGTKHEANTVTSRKRSYRKPQTIATRATYRSNPIGRHEHRDLEKAFKIFLSKGGKATKQSRDDILWWLYNGATADRAAVIAYTDQKGKYKYRSSVSDKYKKNPTTVTFGSNPIKNEKVPLEYDNGYIDGTIDGYNATALNDSSGKNYGRLAHTNYRNTKKPYKRNPATLGSSVFAQTRYRALPYATWFRNAKKLIIGKHKKSRVTRSRQPSAARTPDHYTVTFKRPYVRGGGNGTPGYEIVDNLNKKEADNFARQAKAYGLKEVRIV